MEMESELTEEQQTALNQQRLQRYQQWRRNPETEAFFKILIDAKQEALETWAAGGYTGQNIEDMALRNAKALGGLAVINQVLSLETFDE